ncbi:hypothetical protein AGABI1DRAFT_94088 [Agaricus bisporus var. burnettii JB137-S8]|uniref:BAR domain-containing protein n=1 Tax=Agaricus bisporus var. burnettii (strain JB137-S8 / ATCC MYA-4627 / FGSC 10392) TaxID=597362 RepID=K5WM64_AGABU|nr:uncharacterized protein AGABI1DRAFT_94088 [Agaricus bisporus var. burnettii JB137-S8]EKM76411.1 hypothetical protein AGABI1DRAFT_94088 [Agaricus bisporus var. burnettii JB137-S8]
MATGAPPTSTERLSPSMIFKTVKNGFAKLVEKYGKDFSEVGNVYTTKWDGFMARWNGETENLQSSKNLAAEVSAALTSYGINLVIVADIKKEQAFEDAKLELKDYVETHPIHIATEVVDRSGDLKNDIHEFSKDFTKYIEVQKQKIVVNAKQYQAQVDELNNQMLSTVPANFLTDVIVQRNTTQQKLDAALTNRKRMFDNQMALLAMQATLDIYKPDFDDICRKIHIFAIIWAFKFQVKLKLLIAQIEPLKEGMQQYATQLTPPKASSNEE